MRQLSRTMILMCLNSLYHQHSYFRLITNHIDVLNLVAIGHLRITIVVVVDVACVSRRPLIRDAVH